MCMPSCDSTKQEAEEHATKSEAALEQQASFLEEYKKWESRALAEFPALGVAGSSMNLTLIEYVRDARTRNAPELENPSYVYVFATRVAAQQVSGSPSPVQISAISKPAVPIKSNLHWVRDYVKKDGTVVKGHWAKNPGAAP